MDPNQDHFWLWTGTVIIAAIIGVFILKTREMESLPIEAYNQTRGQVERQIEKAKTPQSKTSPAR